MNANEILRQDTTTEVENNLKIANISESPSREVPVNGVAASPQELMLVPIYLVMILGAIVFVLGLDFKKNLHHQIMAIKYFHKIPCWNCKFFKNNSYLKCAVQPSKVLSKESFDCSDYQSK